MVHASCPGMSVSVHSKKYYKVILEEIDASRETFESFVVKLSVRTRTTLPRAKGLARHLPRTMRQGLSATQANQLKAVLEDIGGRVRLETYLETPGEEREVRSGVDRMPSGDGSVTCPECGTKEEADAEFCGFCHRRFGTERDDTLNHHLPDENPLEEFEVETPFINRAIAWVQANPKWVAGIVVAVLLLLLLIK